MRFGFIPSEGGRLFEQSLREVCYAEELGFDSVWLEEHHGVKDHYWPRRCSAWPAMPPAPRSCS